MSLVIISTIINDKDKYGVRLVRALVAGSTSLLVIGSFTVIVHASPLLLLGSAAIGAYSLISRTEINSFPEALGQGFAMGVTSGVIGVTSGVIIGAGSAAINHQLVNHFNPNHNHNHIGITPTDVGEPLHTIPTNDHDYSTQKTIIYDLKNANSEITHAYEAHHLGDMRRHCENAHHALKDAHHALQDVDQKKPSVSYEAKVLSDMNKELNGIEKAVSDAHPEDPKHDSEEYHLVPNGNSGFPYVGKADPTNPNPWEIHRNTDKINSLKEEERAINSLPWLLTVD